MIYLPFKTDVRLLSKQVHMQCVSNCTMRSCKHCSILFDRTVCLLVYIYVTRPGAVLNDEGWQTVHQVRVKQAW